MQLLVNVKELTEQSCHMLYFVCLFLIVKNQLTYTFLLIYGGTLEVVT